MIRKVYKKKRKIQKEYDYLIYYIFEYGSGVATVPLTRQISSREDLAYIENEILNKESKLKKLSIASYQLIGTREVKDESND